MNGMSSEPVVRACLLTGLLAVNSWSDFRYREIRLRLTVLTGMGGLVWSLCPGAQPILPLLCSLLPGSLLLGLSLLTEGKIGRGDGILVCALGCWLDFFTVLTVLVSGLCLASLAAVICRLKKNGTKELPLIPFLFAAWLLVLSGGAFFA